MLALDEAQMLGRQDLRRLLAGVHRCGQDGLPLYCLFAGLPNLVGDVSPPMTPEKRSPRTPVETSVSMSSRNPATPPSTVGVRYP
ncbi:MAG: hypothetical protein H0V96_04165 [Acidimicrobiia bacterium]|nr:hypothetical protein [Acidimicrobiia bacterium]